ncbi:hypothetical protein HID58_059107 [Brassica napus]|uniref:Potassium transporter n=1 Tax=Brassica napus TaxID=3708 RepID=A0ABQ7ZSN8_BRANA|nr:hypothetical protein HID58_059107 [Brassica napus]
MAARVESATMGGGGEIDEESDERGSMWDLDQKLDQSMDEEAGRLRNMYKEKKFSALLLLQLSFQSLGGTFALYSLLCRHAKVKTIRNQHRTDEELTTYSRSTFHEHSFAAKTKRWLEERTSRKTALLVLVLVGTCMVIGDGVVVLVAVVILVSLFSVQHYGTDRVGWLFAPIVFLWFLSIASIGMYNIWKHDTTVLKAFSPVYIYRYFKRGGIDRWTSLGGIMLSITGIEALFADLSHFPVSAVQIAFTAIVFPCLLLAYSGQAAYIRNHPHHVADAFYRSIPGSVYWPMFIIATAAAIVASQATISATFSLIKQALAHGCFPRVKVVHTSRKFLGQIYVPDINWILMILCIAVTAGFKNQSQIGNAYGTAVVIVMLVTTLLMTLIMILVWRCHWVLVLVFTVLSLVVECTYFSAMLFKVDQGGWVPLVIAAAFLLIMSVWHYGTLKRYEFEMHSRVSMAWILGLGPSLGLVRVPGVGLVYTELASGVPHIFSHFITNLPAIHSVVVFVCVKNLPVYTVPEEERYGYGDLHKKDDDFEKRLFESLFLFIRLESMMEGGCSDSDDYSICGSQNHFKEKNENVATFDTFDSIESITPVKRVSHTVTASSQMSGGVDELEFINRCRDAGVVHIMGNTVVRARRQARFYKKIAIDYLYAFLRKICREHSVIFNVPQESLLNVGQIFYV